MNLTIEPTSTPLSESTFWEIIHKSLKNSTNQEEQLEVITNELEKLSISDIIGFKLCFDLLLNKSYTSELWCAAYLMNEGCSDDTFDYFRSWLISRGEKTYYEAVKNPDKLIDEVSSDIEIYEFEDLDYVPNTVFENKTELEIHDYINDDFYKHNNRPEIEFNWEEENDASLQKICPNLFEYFNQPPPQIHDSLTLDNTTSASIRAKINISQNLFLNYIEIKGIQKIIYSQLLKIPYKLLHKLFKNNEIVNNWISTKEHLDYGCLNSSIIINKEKGIIATFTNLTSYGDIPTPVIKIHTVRLDLFKAVPLKNGDRIPTVSLYYRDEENPNASAWADFEPLFTGTFSNKAYDFVHTLNKLNDSNWECLELGLEQIEDKEDEGLYYITLDDDLVNNSN